MSKTAHPSWPTAAWNIGDKIKFRDGLKSAVIRDAEVIGYDTETRLLCRYELHSGIFAENASIHVNLILPKQIEKVD